MDIENPQSHFDFVQLGKRLSRLREVRGWKLDELAERTGLSLSYLSRMESGDRQPSLTTLAVLAQAYGVTMAALFESDDDPCIIVRGNEVSPQRGNDLLYTRLSRRSQLATLQAIRVTVNPQGTAIYSHEGEEWLYVLSGRLHLEVGEEKHSLESGDAAHFEARVPHRFSASIEQVTEVLIVACVTKHPLLESYK